MSGELMTKAQDWVSGYTPRPHPDLGRSGVVCPYMVKALRRDYVHMVEFDATIGDEALMALARELLARMRRRADELGSDRIYLVNMVVPYGLPDDELKAMVERVHTALKPEWVEAGFMVGDFWPDHETIGLHNDDFRPFTSPLPLLGMRHIVPADLAFFVKHEREPGRRKWCLEMFRKNFATQLNEYWTRELEQAEADVERELAELSAGA
ncbi:DUF6875 domain-containing protein [Streptomyces sp. NRRL WC-3744]|uniref:DUF6875 domain-containing protein n=1 Tax=Streptomyces sp. NRRL WC-3744 TaxID=1463935 RepID=UPI000B00A6E5|nr:hypothetical protein [Streptomyces sp. NRRL WC-3744]